MGTALAFVLDPNLDPASTNPVRRLCAVRGFARHLAGVDTRTEIPPAGVVSYRARRRTPYLYSDDDIVALMHAAAASARTPLRAATLKTLIGLLAVTGMRVGEAIRLGRADIDIDSGLLTVRATKFAKSRQVPVAATTIEALVAYAAVRDVSVGTSETTRFFVSTRGTPLAYSHFCSTFARAVRTAGVGSGSPARPHIHDLRHSFAVRTLVRWHRDGLDVTALLPHLSTYLGHREPRYTYHYLSATPELLGHAVKLLEAREGVKA
jgi:integrase/recombinase XerD